MRLIDADGLIKSLLNHERTENEIKYHCLCDENVIALIQNSPTFELRMGRMTNGVIIPIEIKQGEWIIDKYHSVVCPFCGGIRRDNRIDHINFCNCCGARMRGKEE